MYSRKLLMMGRRWPKHVEFYDRIKLNNWCIWLVIKKKFIAMHGHMNIKITETFALSVDLLHTTTIRKSSIKFGGLLSRYINKVQVNSLWSCKCHA